MIDKHADAPLTRTEEQAARSIARIRDWRRGAALDARRAYHDTNDITTCARVMARARDQEEHDG